MNTHRGQSPLPADLRVFHDVVRNKLVGRIVAAYDKFEAGQPQPSHGRSGRHQR